MNPDEQAVKDVVKVNAFFRENPDSKACYISMWFYEQEDAEKYLRLLQESELKVKETRMFENIIGDDEIPSFTWMAQALIERDKTC